MADILAQNFMGAGKTFTGGDLSAKLKLLGTDVATFGDPFQVTATSKVFSFEDQIHRIYKKLLVDTAKKVLLGGILIGDTKDFARFQFLSRSNTQLSDEFDELAIFPGATSPTPADLPDEAQICSCNNVLAGTLRDCIRNNASSSVNELKKSTKAGTGCGGCVPVMTDLLTSELRASGQDIRSALCEHFPYTRVDLFQIIAAKQIRTFEQLIKEHGVGHGCEICKPTIASLLASIFNEPILKKEHRPLQDSNDKFLANIQKDGTYSVIPRIPGGVITAEKLVTLGEIARRWRLHTKITGGQRIDLLGAKLDDLPDIWRALVSAGFESGHAYGKAMRTVKSCVGSEWCRFGVQDSTQMAIQIENRYKGIRSPHKLKSAVSGCVRECAEAQSKDFGLIATEKGWNIYVCGNGGSQPRHADRLVTDVDADTAVRLLDRFIMFYIRTADRLTRTSVWLEKMEGGINRLRQIIVEDALGIAADLENQMASLVKSYECEWAGVLRDPDKLATFRIQSPTLPLLQTKSEVGFEIHTNQEWVRMAKISELPNEGGIVTTLGPYEIALFHFPARNEWFAVDNLCPHKQQAVLARGILGDQNDCPKVACPLHKNCFDLRTGRCLTADLPAITTYPVKIEGDDIWVSIPAIANAMPSSERRMALT
jgi:NAD(P)H-dependent nitrite reductase large subunit/NAD(P)H-dependent nitrite reductase small subunit